MSKGFFSGLKLLPIVAIFLLLAPQTSYAGYHGIIANGWEKKIRSAIGMIGNADFEKGLSVFEEYIEEFPYEPGGYFFYAVGVQEKIQKLNDFSEVSRFYKYASKCEKLAKQALRKNEGDTIARLFLGGIEGYSALLKVKQKNMIRALLSGVEARKNLERVVRERPEIADTYFGLGMLYYFSSKEADGGIQAWFARKFLTHGVDMRKEGMAITEKSITKKSLSGDYARSALMWMRFYEGEFDKAKKFAFSITKKFPNDVSSRWVLGRMALSEGDCETAERWFSSINIIVARRQGDGKQYEDVKMGRMMSRACVDLKREDYEHGLRAARSVSKWIKGNPVVTIEYQNEKELLARWKAEASLMEEEMTKKIARK